MERKEELLQNVVIKFAGDSGDGMQLTGQQFTNNTALMGIDLATFPDFPAEIRAPIGTLPGVSGFQLHFSSNKVFTPGDIADVLVAMNAAALKVNLKAIKPGGKIIVNIEGFDAKNLRLASYPEGVNPLDDGSLDNYEVIKIDVTKLTREALKDFPELGNKERDRAKTCSYSVISIGCTTAASPIPSISYRKNSVRNQVSSTVISKYYRRDIIMVIPQKHLPQDIK
jgi:2-oxoglutarate ferredoxin oxidoreductase subunit alpha